MRRFLRPRFVVPSGQHLWLVDEFQPVAALLDPVTNAVERLVSWPEMPAPPVTDSPGWHGLRVLGSEAGLWVQPYPGGPVALINTSGLVHASYSAGLRLGGVTAAGAWCGPQPRTRRRLTQRPPEPEELLCLTPEGATQVMTVDRPIGELRAGPDGLYVRVRADPSDHPYEVPHWREPDLGEVWLHLPVEAPVPQRLTRAEHGDAIPPPRPEPLLPGNSTPGSPWHRSDELPGHAAAVASGMRWQVGCDPTFQTIPPVLVTGHDRQDGTEHRRIQLGHGRPVSVAERGHTLWIAVRRANWNALGRSGQVELLRLDARDSSVETVLAPESVGITEHCWPLPAKPPEADSYAEYQRYRFDDLTEHAEKLRRAAEDGDTTALNGHVASFSGHQLRSARAELTGLWPDTAIHLRCAHADYPGLELVRVLPLFDELGREHPPEHASTDLLETLDAGALPPASQARHGQLYV